MGNLRARSVPYEIFYSCQIFSNESFIISTWKFVFFLSTPQYFLVDVIIWFREYNAFDVGINFREEKGLQASGIFGAAFGHLYHTFVVSWRWLLVIKQKPRNEV